DAARHARREITSGATEHHNDAARHVFAAVVARAFDDGNGARVADGEAFASHAAEITLALDRAVQHRVADNDRLLRHDPGICGRPDNEAPAGQPLADIVVGIASSSKVTPRASHAPKL